MLVPAHAGSEARSAIASMSGQVYCSPGHPVAPRSRNEAPEVSCAECSIGCSVVGALEAREELMIRAMPKGHERGLILYGLFLRQRVVGVMGDEDECSPRENWMFALCPGPHKLSTTDTTNTQW